MEVEIKTWAYDILTAIHEIEVFLIDVPDFPSYQNDVKTKRAIERNLEIIGEAMNRILKKDSTLQFTDARKIVEPETASFMAMTLYRMKSFGALSQTIFPNSD
jgi:hypothetical protein